MTPGPSDRQLAKAGLNKLPALIAAAGDRAAWRFIEFFTANIRNPNTRRAYGRAVCDFFRWCEARRIHALGQISPTVVATYVEQHGKTHAKPSVKQHLAAVRMLFDWLVVGQVVPTNPAHSVRGPKHVVKRGKTPVLTREETRELLDSIQLPTLGVGDSSAVIVASTILRSRRGTCNQAGMPSEARRRGGAHVEQPSYAEASEGILRSLLAALAERRVEAGGIESASTCQNIRVFRDAVLHRVAPCGADWTPGSNDTFDSGSIRPSGLTLH